MAQVEGVIITAIGCMAKVSIDGLSDMQRCVGGMIEVLETEYEGEVCSIYLNEEGKMLRLPPNEVAKMVLVDEVGGMMMSGDYLAGDILVLGGVDNEGETLSLPQKVIDKLLTRAAVAA